MSQDPGPDEFENRTRGLLDESAARLDGRTLSRLTQARHAALERLERPSRFGWRMLVPAGAAAAVAVLAVMMWQPDTQPIPGTAQAVSPVEDLELLTDAEAPDFAEENADLDFYEWAAGEMET
jgi:hypothetical protein